MKYLNIFKCSFIAPLRDTAGDLKVSATLDTPLLNLPPSRGKRATVAKDISPPFHFRLSNGFRIT